MQLEEVKKLANMMRMEISDEEALSIGSDMDAVIHYIDQLKEVPISARKDLAEDRGILFNIAREDEVVNDTGNYTEKILTEVPDREGDFVKVKKVL